MTEQERNRDRLFNWGVALSLLLHLLIVAASQIETLPDFDFDRQRREKPMEVEIVREEPKPQPPKPQPPPPPPEPAQAPPDPPKPPPEPPKPKPEPPKPPPPLARPAPPQLQDAPIAEKSTAPKPAETGISFDRKGAPPPPGNLSQSAQDKILGQILRMWHFDSSRFKGTDMTIEMTIIINGDGTLGEYMHKNAPWRPEIVIPTYNSITNPYLKQALESILLALRVSQPLQLPPDDGKGWPRRMVIRFRPGDL